MNEAEKYVYDAMMTIGQQCGTDYYISYEDQRSGGFAYKGVWISQARDIKFSSESEQLSDADKLNGITWKGIVTIRARVFRSIPSSVNWKFVKQWTDWESPSSRRTAPPALDGGYMYVAKRNGIWKFTEPAFNFQGKFIYLVQMTCDELQNHAKLNE